MGTLDKQSKTDDDGRTDLDGQIAQTMLARRENRPPPAELEVIENEAGRASIQLSGKDGALAQIRGIASAGLTNLAAFDMLINQIANVNGDAIGEGDASPANRALAMLDELQPEGGAQAMLAMQMVTIHSATMTCFSRAALSGQTFEGRELNLKHGTKLAALYTRQAETMEKLKRKGQQTVNVKHVHVNDGGQAVIGNVNSIPPH